jgi:GAF domain-containing protein
MINYADSLRQLKEILADQDVRGALIFLNGLSSHRFTAQYRFDDQILHNLYFYDRENPTQKSTPEILTTASYCIFVRNSSDTFAVANAPEDARVHGHPKQQAVQSYCGVPLLGDDGKMFGSICHFDLRPLPISDENVQLLEAVGALLSKPYNMAKGITGPDRASVR